MEDIPIMAEIGHKSRRRGQRMSAPEVRPVVPTDLLLFDRVQETGTTEVEEVEAATVVEVVEDYLQTAMAVEILETTIISTQTVAAEEDRRPRSRRKSRRCCASWAVRSLTRKLTLVT